MPTPNGVNYLLQFLIVSANFADFQNARIKSGRSSYVLMSVAMLPYAILF